MDNTCGLYKAIVRVTVGFQRGYSIFIAETFDTLQIKKGAEAPLIILVNITEY